MMVPTYCAYILTTVGRVVAWGRAPLVVGVEAVGPVVEGVAES